MSPLLSVLFIVLVGWRSADGEAVVSLAKNRSGQFRKKEDYSFESKLKRATEECSYIARTDDESHREELIEKIKNQMNARKVEEFYRKTEDERRRSKEYYANVEREQRKKVLGGSPPLHPHRSGGVGHRGNHPPPPRRNLPPPPRRNLPPPPHSNLPPPPRRNLPPPPRRNLPHQRPFDEEQPHNIFKRSHRPKDSSFSQGTFKDHNNCFSRCVFAGMELVDFLGFPNEAHIRKALEDYVDNKKIRASKIRRVRKCFDDIKKVAIDDNCIYSTRIFKCMRLDEAGTWS